MGTLRLKSLTTDTWRSWSLHEPIKHLLISTDAQKTQIGKGPAAIELKTGNSWGYFCISLESRTGACGQRTQESVFLFHMTHNQIWNGPESPFPAGTTSRSECSWTVACCRRCMHGIGPDPLLSVILHNTRDTFSNQGDISRWLQYRKEWGFCS